MNEDFAVEPSACDDGLQVRRLLRHFGPLDGRYVAEFPGKWRRAFFEHICSWPDIERRRAIEALRQSSSAFVASGRDFDAGASWIENVERVQSTAQPFAGAVVSRATSEVRQCYPTVDQFDPPLADGYIGPLDADRFSELAARLMALSQEVAMVDPYFDVQRHGHMQFLRRILSDCTRYGCHSVLVWTKAEFALGNR